MVAFSFAVHMSARLQLILRMSTMSWAGAVLSALSSFIPISFLTSDLGHQSSSVIMDGMSFESLTGWGCCSSFSFSLVRLVDMLN